MWKKLSGPVRVGLVAAALAIVLTLVGVARGMVPLHPANIGMALFIGAGSWFLVAWAVAAAAQDVETDCKSPG